MEIKLGEITFELLLLVDPIIYILIAVFFYLLISKATKIIVEKSASRLDGKMSEQQKRRTETFRSMISSLTKYVAVIAVTLAILADFGVDVSSLVAGLGILTAIFGLAFQDLIKDIIAGVAIITEDQFEVGDTIEVDGFRGKVIGLGLKTTRIRNYRGKVEIVSNRNLSKIINYSKFDSLAEVEFQVNYETDAEKVENVLKKLKKDLDGTMPQMKGEINYYICSGFLDNGIKYRITCKCKPYEHFSVQRAIRRKLLTEFKKVGISIPYQQVVIKKD